MALRVVYLPILILLSSAAGFITSYIIAYRDHDLRYEPDYISDTGAHPPESSYFTFFLCLTSLFAGAYVIILRLHMQSRLTVPYFRKLNSIAGICGVVAAFGALIVAAFQNVNVYFMHMSGASLCFLCGAFYVSAMTRINFHLGLAGRRVQLGLCIICILALLGGMAFVTMAYWDGHVRLANEVAAGCEWTLAGCFILFFLSLMPVSRHLTLSFQIFDASRGGMAYSGHGRQGAVPDTHPQLSARTPLLAHDAQGHKHLQMQMPATNHKTAPFPTFAPTSTPTSRSSQAASAGPRAPASTYPSLDGLVSNGTMAKSNRVAASRGGPLGLDAAHGLDSSSVGSSAAASQAQGIPSEVAGHVAFMDAHQHWLKSTERMEEPNHHARV